MMRPKVFHGTYSMICANSVLPTFIPHSRFVKPGMIANAQYEIQIVDTHESLETLIIVGVAVGTSQFNRTLVSSYISLSWTQSFLTETANVIHHLICFDHEAAIGSHGELAASIVCLEFRLVADLHAAGSRSDFHQLRGADIECERTGQNHADGLARAIGKQYRMRHTLAVEKHITLFNYADIVELRHAISSPLFGYFGGSVALTPFW